MVVEECTVSRERSVLATEVVLIAGVKSAVSLLVTLGVRGRLAAAAVRSFQSTSSLSESEIGCERAISATTVSREGAG
jgi:hypothetical protein